MKYLRLSIAILSFAFQNASAQLTEGEKLLRDITLDTLVGWNTGGIVSLSFSQSSYTNWSAGGQNSLSGNGLVSVFANFKGVKSSWDNSLDLGYGVLMQGKDQGLLKTEDKIELITKYGQKAFGNWFYAALGNFKTQFTPGYNYPNDTTLVSDFISPAYVLGALGMDFKPNNEFSLFISPITAKLTFVNNQMLANAGAFGIEPAVYDSLGVIVKSGKTFRAEMGGYVRSQFQMEVMKNVVVNTKLDLFSNYLNNPGNIDVNWNTLVAVKANEFITATISTELIYDDDIAIAIDSNEDGIPERIGPRVQLKEVLGIGLSYKF